MRILGIDPGSTTIGFGLIEVSRSRQQLVDFGVIKAPSLVDNQERVVMVHARLQELIKKHSPDRAALEKLFYFKNAKTVIQVSELRGVLLLALRQAGLPIFEYTPLQVKQAVSSYGRAEKAQVQTMVKLILGLKQIPKPDDAADALAIAICCANSEKL